jgi:UDP-glucose/galactose:(glucosyl)LPS alpha-1,2-glucosyl/galactosyltransferase
LPLFQEDLGTNLIGAVASPTTGWEAHCERFGIDPKQGYFNSGVLLMNLDLMRCENFTARALQLAADKNKILQFPDQDVLNISTIGRWRKLHPKWNAISYLWLAPQVSDRAYSALEYSLAKHSPGIVHFEGPATVKPWYFRSMHPMRQLYLQFRAQTPWPLQELEGRTLKALGLRMLPLKCQHQLTRFKIMVRDFFSARP